MINKIAELIEFDPNRFSENQIIEEFNHKFINSLLRINGEYYKVHILEAETLHVKNFDGDLVKLKNFDGDLVKLKKISSIEKVLPKTGLYSSEFGLLYLYRLPKRQWIKSILLGANYQVLRIIADKPTPSLLNTVLVENPKYAKESIIHNNKVYLHWLLVGYVVDDTIFVKNKNFFEEIKELWNPQYQITLDVNRPQPKEEKLILDF